jgi:MFS transporter, DHA1 family, multidrug resistance protein
MTKTTSPHLISLIIALLAMLGPFAIDAYFPTFDIVAHEFHVPVEKMQLTLSAYLAAFAFSTLIIGPLSDSFGRRNIIFISLICFFFASIASIFAQNLEQMIISRIFQGMSGGAGLVVGQALIRDIFSGEIAQKTLSNVTTIFGLAPAIAPILGGYLFVHFGWRSIFIFLALFTLVVMALVWKNLPETLELNKRHSFKPRIVFKNYAIILTKPEFLLRIMVHTFGFATAALYISSSQHIIIKVLKLQPTDFGWLFVPFVAGMMLGSYISNKVAGKIKGDNLIFIGFAICLLASIGNLIYTSIFAPTIPWAILPLFFYVLGYSIIIPYMTLITLELLPQMRGTASAVQNFIRMNAFALISAFIAPLVFDSAFKLALCMFGTLMIATALWVYCDKTYGKRSL